MVRTLWVMWTVIAGVMMASAVVAQDATAPAAAAQPRPLDRSDLKDQIYVMEGALARAVSHGAQRLNKEIRTVVPEMVVLSGEPQARGVYLEGYGVYFDVGVPILRQSMVWSLRNMLDQDDNKRMKDAITLLKQDLNRITDPRARASIEGTIAQLELQISPMPGSDPQRPPLFPPRVPVAGGGGPPGDTVGTMSSEPPKGAPSSSDPALPLPPRLAAPPPSVEATRIDRMFLQDPGRAYTESVQRALIEAMIDYSMPMAIGPDEWLTVGARDNMQRDSLAPADPFEEIVTILLRIKGSDLAAHRAAQIDRVEIRRRVQIREF